MKLISILNTKIFASDIESYERFLKSIGLENFFLFPDRNKTYLNIQFTNGPEVMKYKLHNAEDRFKLRHKDSYLFDLDSSWEREARQLFGDDDY